MTKEQMIVTIVVAIIGGIATALGGGFAFAQFLIKRKDEKEANSIKKQIEDAVSAAEKKWSEQLEKVSMERSLEGKKRFETHAASIEEINKQIKENSAQIGELTGITKNVLESMGSLTKVVGVTSESQKNINYDRILVVANKALKNKQITVTEKTNLIQLYNSWEALHKEKEVLDPRIKTIYDECMKLTVKSDEE